MTDAEILAFVSWQGGEEEEDVAVAGGMVAFLPCRAYYRQLQIEFNLQ